MKSALLVATLLVGGASLPAHAADFTLNLLGSTSIATGTLFQGVEFGGISGLDRAADGSYWAISDDRGGERGTPRFYNLSLNYSASGFQSVVVNSMTYMQRPDGSLFPSTTRTVDPESIRLAPNGNLYWASEGNFNANPSLSTNAFVREMTTAGVHVREFSTPAMYDYVPDGATGARSNKVFEALTVGSDGTVYVANEDALVQDGAITTLNAGSVVRMTALNPGTGQVMAQYAYELPPIPVNAAPGAPFGPDNGLSEMLALEDGRFLMVERAFAFGVGNTIRLVLASVDADTTDVSGFAALAGASYTPMRKELLLEMPILFEGVALDNIEAISWGQTLPNGNRTLVLAADNNFSGIQSTQFLVFEVSPVPEPAAAWLLLAGLAALAGRRRSRS